MCAPTLRRSSNASNSCCGMGWKVCPIATRPAARATWPVKPWPATGVIASAYSAELYDLEVLAPNIEDAPYNYTRFFVVGTTHAPRSRYNKTSIVFATRHETCALYDCLGELATRGINFTKVESRPRRNRPWEPIFFVDFEGHWSDEDCQRALVGLLQRSAFVQLLGSYPGARGELVGI